MPRMVEGIPNRARLYTKTGTIVRISLERRGAASRQLCVELKGSDGALAELRIADWGASEIKQIELESVRYHEHGLSGYGAAYLGVRTRGLKDGNDPHACP